MRVVLVPYLHGNANAGKKGSGIPPQKKSNKIKPNTISYTIRNGLGPDDDRHLSVKNLKKKKRKNR